MITVLKTKRLTLRPLSTSDRDPMIDTIMSDMDVMYWLPYSDKVLTFEGAGPKLTGGCINAVDTQNFRNRIKEKQISNS